MNLTTTLREISWHRMTEGGGGVCVVCVCVFVCVREREREKIMIWQLLPLCWPDCDEPSPLFG